MNFLNRIKFRLGTWAFGSLQRGYSEVTSTGKQMSDWIMNGIGEDADLQANWPLLCQRSRDLFKLNPYMRKFATDLIANVFGSEGITLQMKIKEEADRVVYSEEEKAWLLAKQRAHEDLAKRAKAHGINIRQRDFIRGGNGESLHGRNGDAYELIRAKAVVKAGQPDVYANNLHERAWKEWQKKQNCTVSKRHTYAQTRHQRLKMCARDGDVFIRHIRGKAAQNRFNYAIQLISAEWIDHALSQELSGNRFIKMGIEYNEWNQVVAYYVIKRKPGDWRSSYTHGMAGHCMSTTTTAGYSPDRHERVEARDMIHYCLFEDSESGRSAPWAASVMTKLRHLDKYGEAEVISARAEACKGGHYEAEMPGLDAATDLADYISQINTQGQQLSQVVEPAMWKPLPFGWRAKAHDPKHPNGNYGTFKKEVLREISVGVGDFYNTMAGDMEGVNYSSMRGGFLDIREFWMLVQRFDIDTAEIPIFEAWLEMALMSGAIPLPLSKFDKFNQPKFQGRRWPWVDPKSDALADSAKLKMITTSRGRICNENGDDFEEILEEQAIEKLLIEESGLSAEVDVIAGSAEEEQDLSGTNAPAKPTGKKARVPQPAELPPRSVTL